MPDVPSVPLPGPQYVRLALVGDGSARAEALHDVLGTTGRVVEHSSLADCVPRLASLEADVVVLCGELDELLATAPMLRLALADIVVLCCAAPAASGPTGVPTARSAVSRVSAALPKARVVGALQQFSAEHFRLIGLGLLETDAPVSADDPEAADLVEALLDEIPGVQGVFAGPLRLAQGVEGIRDLLDEVERVADHPVGFRLDPLKGVILLHGR